MNHPPVAYAATGKSVTITVAAGGYIVTSLDPVAQEQAYRMGMSPQAAPPMYVRFTLEEAIACARLCLGEPPWEAPNSLRELAPR